MADMRQALASTCWWRHDGHSAICELPSHYVAEDVHEPACCCASTPKRVTAASLNPSTPGVLAGAHAAVPLGSLPGPPRADRLAACAACLYDHPHPALRRHE